MARRGGRTAADVALSDCQYRKGTTVCGQSRVQVVVEAVVSCPESEFQILNTTNWGMPQTVNIPVYVCPKLSMVQIMNIIE